MSATAMIIIDVGSLFFGLMAVFGIIYPTSKFAKRFSFDKKSKIPEKTADTAEEIESGTDSEEITKETTPEVESNSVETDSTANEASEDMDPEETTKELYSGLKKPKTQKIIKTVYCICTVVMTCVIGLLFTLNYVSASEVYCLKRVAIVSILFVAAYYDFKSYRIPNKLIIYGLILRLVFVFAEVFSDINGFVSVIISEGIAVLAVIILSVICIVVVKNGLGFGDIKLFVLIALMQGLSGMLSAIFASLIVSFFYSLVLIIAKKKNRKDFIPFAPCILLGTTVSVILMGA